MKFLSTIFHDKRPDDVILIWTLPDKLSRYFTNPDEAEAYAKTRLDSDVYFGVCLGGKPKSENERFTAKDVVAVPGFWADIDIDANENATKQRPKNRADAQKLIDAIPKKVSVVVDTGHGIHAYWLFDKMFRIDDEDNREVIAMLARRFTAKIQAVARREGWAVDNTSDLARVLRMPGTINLKHAPDFKDVAIEKEYQDDCEAPGGMVQGMAEGGRA
jgi:putative DNA primase/helicase